MSAPIDEAEIARILMDARATHRLHRPDYQPVPTYEAVMIFIGLFAGALVGTVLLEGAAMLVGLWS